MNAGRPPRIPLEARPTRSVDASRTRARRFAPKSSELARGPVELVDPAIALAGFRIAQEALTNASRHTLGAEVQVNVTVDSDTCDITVVNRGGETIDLGRGSGFGLVSMRERAKSVGGSLVAGPTADGWTVDASLPVDAFEVRR